MSLLENKRVLVVEDTTIAATYLARELTHMGAEVVGLARSESQAVEMAEELKPELILMDIHLADGGSGIEAARIIASKIVTPLIYTTSFSDDTTLSQALETSPYGYIVKPFDTKTLKVSCETALKRFELEQKIVFNTVLPEIQRESAAPVSRGEVLPNETEKKHRLSDVIFDQLSEGVAIIDDTFIVTEANRSLATLLTGDVSTLKGQDITRYGFNSELFSRCDELAQSDRVYRHKLSLRNGTEAMFPAFITLSCLDVGTGRQQYILTVSDISDLSRAERKLEELAFRDPLTGTGNRNYMKLLLDEVKFSRCIQSLIFIDLDGFKQINDRYGHDIGDALLVTCAQRLQSELRNTDTLIRHGGDEFVVLVQDNADILTLTQKMLVSLAKPYHCHSVPLSVTASIGVADFDMQDSTEDLLKHADIAMYEAKKQGKNQTVVYSSDHETAIEYRLLVEESLLAAIKNQDLYASFQPIVDGEGNVVALEALCRWRGKDVKDMQPDTFIPVAEETGLINPLGLKMLREVCIASGMLEAQDLSHIRIHINVSLLQLSSTALVDQFVTYFADFNVSPSSVVIEISERAIVDAGAKRIIRALEDYGFTVALDDFGHGLVALSELTDNRASVIKFDGTWLARLEDEPMRLLAASLVDLNKRLGKSVIFEGIESPAQAAFAREVGADLFQGFLYARPKSLTEILRMLAPEEARVAY